MSRLAFRKILTKKTFAIKANTLKNKKIKMSATIQDGTEIIVFASAGVEKIEKHRGANCMSNADGRFRLIMQKDDLVAEGKKIASKLKKHVCRQAKAT